MKQKIQKYNLTVDKNEVEEAVKELTKELILKYAFFFVYSIILLMFGMVLGVFFYY